MIRFSFIRAHALQVCKAHALFRRKPAFPFFEFTLTHRGSAKHMAEPGVGLQPNVACELKTGRLS